MATAPPDWVQPVAPAPPPTGSPPVGDEKERASPALITAVVVLGVIAALVVLGTLARLAVQKADDVSGEQTDQLDEGTTDGTWDPGFKRRAIAVCMDTSGLPADQARSQCTCIFGRLEEDLTYDEVVAMDERISRDPSYLPPEIQQAAAECA